ncbi:hypothetical protein R3W88_029590 [Solanum pinnatisectum]|uniref:Secreted protein n=1 Tax=Solanum pinnatisectum TaxID=50273 RepID=A0AAV9K801_9SOLN|nr:hypothetical protein R3W88_029590 [Solanum pinnatisectum]
MYHEKLIGKPWLLLTLLTRSLCQLRPHLQKYPKKITCRAKYLVTPGSCEDLLRGQVKTLLQMVEEDVLFFHFDVNM